jgi:ELWxxDGT repeat protein
VLATLGGRTYYIAGGRIIATDWTAAGTTTLVELAEGELVGLVATSRRLYFVNWLWRTQELWTSDGTPAGTRRLRRFGEQYGGTRFDLPMMSHAGGVVFPECPLGGPGCHLTGVTDSNRTIRLTPDIVVPYPRSVVLHTSASGVLFADGDGGLWRTDGSRKGTTALGRCAGECKKWYDRPFVVARVGKRNLFSAVTTPEAERQVWVTDGTNAGTRPLDADCWHRNGCGTELIVVNGNAALLELTHIFEHSREVARLDRSAVYPVAAPGDKGPAVASGDGFLVVGDRLVWLAADGSVRASMPIPGRRDGDASPRSLIALGQQLVFTACDGNQQRIYRTDGTPGAVVALADGAEHCSTYGPPLPPLALGGAVVVDTTRSIVRVDSVGNVVTLLDSYAEAMAPAPATAEALVAFRPAQTAAGFDPIRCPAGGDVCRPGELARLGDKAFLLYGDLWRIDGDAATRIAPPRGSEGFDYSNLAAVEGALYFVTQPAGEARVWLYRSDGTGAGTVALAPIDDAYRQTPFRPLGLNGRVYFTAYTPELGQELWVSDGTPAGTHPFLDLRAGAAGSRPMLLSVAAGRLFFAADDGVHGIELWSTDGVAAHTAMVADIAPGPLSSWPGRPVVAGGRLCFAAEDGVAGSELWAVPLAP